MTSQIIFAALRDVLAELYQEEDAARIIVDDTGLSAIKITFSARAQTNWHNILTEAIRQHCLDALLNVARSAYGGNPTLSAALAQYRLFIDNGGVLEAPTQLPTYVSRLQSTEIVGKSLREEQYAIVLNWDRKRRLRGFDLSNQDLSDLLLVRADLRGANLAGADLRGTNLNKADLRRANLVGAQLGKANLRNADLQKSILINANLTRANLRACELSKADLRNANLFASNLHLSCLSEADLRGANLTKAYIHDADLRWVNLRGANLNESYLAVVNLFEASLVGANLRMATLSESHLRKADLSETDLRDADLRDADLRGVNFSGADLSKADLRGANLSKASEWYREPLMENWIRRLFGLSPLLPSQHKETNLSGVKWDGTQYNAKTIWPEEFIPPPEAIRLDE